MNKITPFEGITILYADDINGDDIIKKAVRNGCDFIIEENIFHKTPQSKRIKWCQDTWDEISKTGYPCCVLTNDYLLIRLLELIVPQDMFRIYNMDTNEIVKTFIKLEPNPTLDVYDYLYRDTVKKAFPSDNF